MPRHASSSKTSGGKMREPTHQSSSSAVPFNPAGGAMHEDMGAKRPYGGGKSAHSRGASALSKLPEKHESRSAMIGSGGAKAGSHGQAPPATSMQGSLGIIENTMSGGNRNRPVGIPGIISSTSLGPEQRQRLVAGIIESPMEGRGPSGPVHAVMGHDATAYNEGMVHLRGSPFK